MINDANQAAKNPDCEITLRADKGYDAKEFIDALQEINDIPHVAQNTLGRRSAVPAAIAASEGYAISVQKDEVKIKLPEQGATRARGVSQQPVKLNCFWSPKSMMFDDVSVER